MNYIHYFWNKLKQEPDIWFFYGFLLSFSFSIRKVLFYFPIQGTFNEYTGIYVYISDILLFFTMLSWIILILSNKQSFLSNYRLWITQLIHRLCCKIALELKFLFFNHSIKLPHNYCKNISTNKSSACSTPAPLFPNVPHGTSGNFTGWNIPQNTRRAFIIIPLILIMWSFISSTWSSNQNIAFFRSIKLFEYYLLYLYIAIRFVPRLPRDFRLFHVEQSKILRGGISESFTGWKNFTLIIIIIALLQSFIGIIQFTTQHSIGIFWLKESLISSDIAGVAKIIINGHKYIRSYGLFPHPNILGGFLLFSIIITLLYYKMFHGKHIEEFKYVPRGTYLSASIVIQILALFLTFSKSAIFGLAIALIYVYVPQLFHGVFHACPVTSRCSTWNIWKFYGVEHSDSVKSVHSLNSIENSRNSRTVLLTFLIILLSLYLSCPTIAPMIYNSVEQRLIYFDVSRGTILSNSVIGVGIGQFVLNMSNYVYNLELWQFQPVHNVFLLIWSELGIIGLGLFTYWLHKMFHVEQNTPHPSFGHLLLSKEKGNIVPRGTILKSELVMEELAPSPLQGEGWGEVRFIPAETNSEKKAVNNKSILQNKYYCLSNDIPLCYFKAILIGFICIMLFDHYFWDIQQGSIILWMTAGIIAGLNKNIT